jgi:hypothetical protein
MFMPWELWLLAGSWLELADCANVVKLARFFRDKHRTAPLSPVELDLSRIELIIGALRSEFVASLGLVRWRALRVLDLSEHFDQELVAALSARGCQVRCIRAGPFPDICSWSSSTLTRYRNPLCEYGWLNFESVQVGPSFEVVWVLPRFAELNPPVVSPKFRALGHDWYGLVFPKGNPQRGAEKFFSIYVSNHTIKQERDGACRPGLMTVRCVFSIAVLGHPGCADVVHSAKEPFTFGENCPDEPDRGWHFFMLRSSLPYVLQDSGRLLIRLRLTLH